MEERGSQDETTVRAPRRKLRFGLRSLFVAMTLLAVIAGVWSWHLRSKAPLGLDGYCPVTLTESRMWCKGNPRFASMHQGRRYLLVGAAEKSRFEAQPDIYSPVASGCDVVLAMDGNYLVEGKREHGVFFDGRIYLFAEETTLEDFNLNPRRYAAYAPTFAKTFAGQRNSVQRGSDDSRTFVLSIQE